MTGAGVGRRAGLILVGTLVGFGLLALALAGRWTALTHAVAAVPLVTIAAAALLQLASLVARSEAWHRCVLTARGTVSRDQLYREMRRNGAAVLHLRPGRRRERMNAT